MVHLFLCYSCLVGFMTHLLWIYEVLFEFLDYREVDLCMILLKHLYNKVGWNKLLIGK